MNNNAWGGGTIGTNYRGNRAQSPVNVTYNDRAPTIYDTQNVVVGDEWVDTTTDYIYKLIALAQTSLSQGFILATWELLAGSGGGNLDQIDTDSGNATPTAGVITLAGGSNINTSGTGSTATINLDSSPSISGSFTAGTGISTTSGGIVAVAGNISATAGNINATLGSMSAGTTITAGTGISTSTGNITALAGSLSLPATNTAGTQGVIFFNASRFVSQYGTNNTFVGQNSGNSSLTTASSANNSGFGLGALAGLTTSPKNCAAGAVSLNALSTGSGLNTAMGYGSLSFITSGTNNVSIGQSSGANYASSESNNILIGYKLGTLGESGVTRIGNTGTTTQCFIDGIASVSVANTNMVTINTSTGQLGSTAVPSGGLVLIQKKTATAQASLAFTTGISSTYPNYLFVGDSITDASASTTVIAIQLSIDGGATYISTAYVGSGITTGMGVGGITDSTATAGFNSTLYNLTSGVGIISCGGTYTIYDTSGPTAQTQVSAGAYTVAGQAVNAFRVVTSDATSFSGNFTLYGLLP
jgi:hypothetical protein